MKGAEYNSQTITVTGWYGQNSSGKEKISYKGSSVTEEKEKWWKNLTPEGGK